MAFAEGQRHVAAHRVADERAALDAQRLEAFGHRVGEELHRMAFARNDRDAVPREVECYDTELFVEQRDEIIPNEKRLEVAVEQYDAPLALLRVADVQGRGPCHDEFFGHAMDGLLLLVVIVEVIECRFPAGVGVLLVLLVVQGAVECMPVLAAFAHRFEAFGFAEFVRMRVANSLRCFHG